ncbi:MAG: phosphate acyltransferase PlsX [Candidatus Dormibacteraeota bacterium]|nr:phosphate acyltransferase PlsX [Candidatus Dormibacteraeota bacterium]
MRIAVDGMGGDRGPHEIVAGAGWAAEELGAAIEVIVVGVPETVQPLLDAHPRLRFTPASEVVTMSDHPAQAIRSKPQSSMSVCARLCKQGEADAWVSAGNSGAVLAASLLIQGRLRGVERPALGTVLPTVGAPAYFLDVGANVDSRPEYLVQFGQMGAVYARELWGRPDPGVGLLSNGEEEDKGDELVREAGARLRRSAGVRFIGNVEPKDVLGGRVDVVVADGFVGNVAIKMAEATAELIFEQMRREVPRGVRGRVGGLLIRPGVRRIRDRMDWREFGGAPLLGVDGVAVVAHGRSDARAVRNAVRVAQQAVESGLAAKIREAIGR